MTDAPEAHVDHAFLERLDLIHRRHFDERQLDSGMFVAKAANDLWQHAVQRRADETDRQAALDLADAPRHRFELRRLREQLHCVRIEEAPCVRQFDGA
jgi:hypothetical protein